VLIAINNFAPYKATQLPWHCCNFFVYFELWEFFSLQYFWKVTAWDWHTKCVFKSLYFTNYNLWETWHRMSN